MGISGISSAGILSYVNHVASQKTNNIRKVDSANNFQDVMKTASEEQQNTHIKDTVWAGDMVVSQPPDYR